MLLVSSRIFEKRRTSCFTNLDLKDFLEENGAKSIEFIGVDGNGCVKASVLAATKENYQVSEAVARLRNQDWIVLWGS